MPHSVQRDVPRTVTSIAIGRIVDTFRMPCNSVACACAVCSISNEQALSSSIPVTLYCFCLVMSLIKTKINSYSQYTPPTQLNCRVELRRRRRCVLNSQLAHDDCRRVWSKIWKLNMLRIYYPIHTADATQLSSCVASAVCTQPSAVVTQFTILQS